MLFALYKSRSRPVTLLKQRILQRKPRPHLPYLFETTATTSATTTSRCFSKNDSSLSCPFQVLGVERNVDYDTVKKAFVKLALVHHPDVVVRDEDANTTTITHDKFLTIRRAFESIQNHNGQAVHHTKNDSVWTDETLATWFHQQTGQQLSFHLDSKTRRELTTVATTMSPGGLDRGGMWELARTVARHGAGGGADPLAVESGSSDTNTSASSGRRRRKRK